MKSYIKIYGPPLLKTIRTLEKIAVDMPEVCIMDSIIEASYSGVEEPDALNYFTDVVGGVGLIPTERCSKIISKSGQGVGEYDFYFEWFKNPTAEEMNNLIEKVDNALTPLGCRYTITTKSR